MKKTIDVEHYKAAFADKPSKSGAETNTRATRALEAALDIRKFEIELYWKRATYFWAFITAAFAGYALTYKDNSSEPWLSTLFSALGLVFAFAWFLVNKGSKFWQNNWERHVDLLEEISMGPLYTIVAVNSERNLLTSADRFSVTKINQMLSFFVALVWLVVFIRSIGPVSPSLRPDLFKIAVVVLTLAALICLWTWGQSRTWHGTSQLFVREFDIDAPSHLLPHVDPSQEDQS